ncbi:TetR/AcrR family transcriptional regulator [Aquabacter spiritensis]|uniref:HTH tetR-type domain-containing protein n=1 Tax=Aquabacter spiritensis TaxID=933073 RepID=A0A4R3M4H4_9HYPH|nr:TetR/AcrR family transcriptional regulator [Aquabacter spiritensis]TCT08224.1 hypothetical protein EDC64_101746 [Aquabacter spiritensis]
MASEMLRDACLRAFLDLVATRGFERVSLDAVAAQAGVALSELRAAYGTPLDLVAAFLRATDRQVLAEGGPDGVDLAEPAQERLFEVLMRRLDALEPHKAAVASLMRSARRNPLLALALLRLSVRSQRWMLAAAGIDATGLSGDARAHGLALLFGRLVDVWLEDDDPGLARTMAQLDRELQTGAKLLGMLDDLATIATLGKPRRGRAKVEETAPTS